MARIPLLGGAYQSRSIIANAQRAVNYYPEFNPKDSPVLVTQYQRPGLRQLVQSGPTTGNPVRGIWRASNGQGYAVIGQKVFFIDPSWTLVQLGTLTINGTNPCSFVDNGANGLLVDGSPLGYSINLATNAFAQVVDGTGTFNGADRVDTIDTFVVWNLPGTNQFGSTLSNSLTFNALYVAGKVTYPDPIQALIVNRHEILLIGQVKSEIWYDAGQANFPFAELPGAYHEHGTAAKYSLAAQDINTYFLGQDREGQGIVFRIRGYECKRISNHALEYQIQQMLVAGHSISDAIGYCYQQGGHVFYVLTFPSGNQTWVFDEATDQWHQRAWTDANGGLNRDRTNCHAFIYGQNVVGDWDNGTLYALDPATYTDNGQPISFIRSFPHLVAGEMSFGLPGLTREVPADGQQLRYTRFQLDLEAGMGPLDASGNPALVGLRWSADRGRTFGNTIRLSAGKPGEYLTRPQWRALGVAQDMVFEISHSIAGPAALNGAWVSAEVIQQ